MKTMKNMKNKALSSSLSTYWSNPLCIVVCLLIVLLIALAIFKSTVPFFGVGINVHLGDLKGGFNLEAYENESMPNESIPNESNPEFIFYYAEWCGHCKKCKPEFQKLMDNNTTNISVVMIDSEAIENKDLVQSQNIKGFPTIRYYPTGRNGTFNEYNEGRTYNDFTQYLQSVQT